MALFINTEDGQQILYLQHFARYYNLTVSTIIQTFIFDLQQQSIMNTKELVILLSLISSVITACPLGLLNRMDGVISGAAKFSTTRDLSLVVTLTTTPNVYHFQSGVYVLKTQITGYNQILAVAVSEDQSSIYLSAQATLGTFGLFYYSYNSGTLGPPFQLLTLSTTTIFSFIDTTADGKMVIGSADNLVSTYDINNATLQTFTCLGNANQVAISEDGLTIFMMCNPSPQIQIYSRTSLTLPFISLAAFDLPFGLATGHMLKIDYFGTKILLSDGVNSYQYKFSIGSYIYELTYANSASIAFSDDLTYIWRDTLTSGHSAECMGIAIQNIICNTNQQLYRSVSIATDGSAVLAFGENPSSIDYYFTCIAFSNCLSCSTTACLICQLPYVTVNGLCIICNLTNCAICSSSITCQTCNPSFNLTTSFSCSCATNYTISLNTTLCALCSIPYCLRCDIDGICALCNTSFSLIAGSCACPTGKKLSNINMCVTCSVIGCKTCSADNVCFTCFPTFTHIAGTCICPTNTTLSINNTLCATCVIGFCKRCDINNMCASCNPTFTSINGTCMCTQGSTFNVNTSSCTNNSYPNPTIFILAAFLGLFGVTIIGMFIYIKTLGQVQPPPEYNAEPGNYLRTTEKTNIKFQDLKQMENSQLELNQEVIEPETKPRLNNKQRSRRIKSKKKVQMSEIINQMDILPNTNIDSVIDS